MIVKTMHDKGLASVIVGLGLLHGAQALAEAVENPIGTTDRPQHVQLIDNFDSGDTKSPLGTRWLCFTDRVMGGVSNGAIEPKLEGDFSYLHMTGDVSLENNGGFVQMALRLGNPVKALDASAYDGIRITAKGKGDLYSIHLRTQDLRRPWQYYAAPLAIEEGWTTVDIPFSTFTAESTTAPLDQSALTRLGIVAAWETAQADIAVAHVELYKDSSSDE